MTGWAARRFWQAVSVDETPEGYGIRLDNRPVRTPAKVPLLVPSRPLAEAIAAEWAAQDGVIAPQTMPFTRTANSALDNVAANHAAVAGIVAAYGETDLLCYRAESPAELVARQAEAWDPLLDWAAHDLGARLHTGAGVMHIAQPQASTAALAARVHGLDTFRLAALHDLVALSGSLVIGLALMARLRPADALWALSRVDETWQAEQWGTDPLATAEADAKRADFLHASRVIAHLDTS